MSDLIDRQDAIDAIYEHEFSNWCDKDEVSTILSDLPSAEPEIIYCKDCIRHNVSVGDWYDNHELKVCPLVGHRGSAIGHEFDYQFCAYAERRTDELNRQQ